MTDAVATALQHPQAGRIFAMMGPNGAGKTRLLGKLKEKLSGKLLYDPSDKLGMRPERTKVFMIPASRKLSGSDIMATNPGLPAAARDGRLFEGVLEALASTDRAVPFGRVLSDLIHAIHEQELKHEREWQQSLVRWAKEGEHGAPPKVPASLLKSIEAATTELLGFKCTISASTPSVRPQEAPQMVFHRGAEAYNIVGLSDGEKQIVLISVFLLASAGSKFCCLIDEPELHLNEARAMELWERVEGLFPKAVFFYATHSVSFASRASVDRNFLIDPDEGVVPLDRDQALPAAVVRDIIGARVQLLKSSLPSIFCEDNLSRMVLSDIFSGENVEVIKLDNCQRVQAAVKGESLWETVRSKGLNFCGVIDRDVRDDDDVRGLEQQKIFCFPLYEAESLLLDQDVAQWLLRTPSGGNVSADSFKAALVEAAKKSRSKTLELLAKHLAKKAKAKFAPILAGPNAPDLNVVIDVAAVRSIFRKRAGEMDQAISDSDSAAIAKLFKGKMLYPHFAEASKSMVKGGLTPRAATKYNEIRHHLEFRAILSTLPWVQTFKQKVLSAVQ